MAQKPKKKSGCLPFFAILVVVFFLAHNFSGGKTDPQPSAPPAFSSDPRQLAVQVLKLSDDIQLPDATHAALDHYARTGEVFNFCGDKLAEVDPLLLQNMLKLQQDGFRILVNNLGIGNDRVHYLCYNSDGSRTHDQHTLLRAVDLNGIIKKGGPQTPWGGLTFHPGPEMQAIQAYADAWLASLPINRGGVGQQDCLDGSWPRPGGFRVAIPPGSPNVLAEAFGDACSHLHLDVRIR